MTSVTAAIPLADVAALRRAAPAEPPASPLGALYQASGRRNIPTSVVIELTRKCNLTCVHCYASPETGRREMSVEDYRRLIDDLQSLGTLFVLFTGGDVTVNPHFLDIARYASDRRLAVQVFTNAVLLDDADIDALAGLNLFHVAISVYGASAETHDAITRLSGSFARTIRNAVKLHDRGIYTVLKYIMMKGNVHEYAEMKALGDRLGIPYRVDTNLSPRDNRDLAPLQMRISDDELRRIFNDQIHCFPGAKPCSTPDLAFGCGMGRTFCSVNAYGDIYPCVQMPVPVGNLHERSFSEIWRGSPKLEFFRTYPGDRELPVCSSCEDKPYCSRCPGQAFQETGDFYAPYEEACRQARTWRVLFEEHVTRPDGSCTCGKTHAPDGKGLGLVSLQDPL
jgi:radical SAM protein with 4Fe4S-binding SPASM domain